MGDSVNGLRAVQIGTVTGEGLGNIVIAWTERATAEEQRATEAGERPRFALVHLTAHSDGSVDPDENLATPENYDSATIVWDPGAYEELDNLLAECKELGSA
jgi:hypothetical protein